MAELLTGAQEALSLILALVVPIFVAMDPLGALPLIVAWTGNLEPAERRRQLRDALVTALVLGLLFLVAGTWLLAVLGVTVTDFLIAGGLVLLILAVSDIAVGGSHEARGSTDRRTSARCRSGRRSWPARPPWRRCSCKSTATGSA